MFDDELEQLATVPGLLDLLGHYATAGAANREAWLDRLMVLGEFTPNGLVRLHGLLIAFGWLEQNTGCTPPCYQVTAAGYRVSRQRGELQAGQAIPESRAA